ncbi:hypothetical protein PROFUN_14474 [Planoprotostelium fungivorum]|uniref:Uncharacterized protein n=1 Tax=Planoprotostelium fungivorum TaxID=1890364 RepID=A0A2P6MZW2_9EUKA|nr:hypothetical protein PROFUN_14474 [Planoprotostelium fungivorum]
MQLDQISQVLFAQTAIFAPYLSNLQSAFALDWVSLLDLFDHLGHSLFLEGSNKTKREQRREERQLEEENPDPQARAGVKFEMEHQKSTTRADVSTSA